MDPRDPHLPTPRDQSYPSSYAHALPEACTRNLNTKCSDGVVVRIPDFPYVHQILFLNPPWLVTI